VDSRHSAGRGWGAVKTAQHPHPFQGRLYASIYSTKRSRMPNLHQASTSASCDLEFGPPDPRRRPFHALHPWRAVCSCVPVCTEVGSFGFKIWRSQIISNGRRNRRMDGRTDGWTDGQVENIMPPTLQTMAQQYIAHVRLLRSRLL